MTDPFIFVMSHQVFTTTRRIIEQQFDRPFTEDEAKAFIADTARRLRGGRVEIVVNDVMDARRRGVVG